MKRTLSVLVCTLLLALPVLGQSFPARDYKFDLQGTIQALGPDGAMIFLDEDSGIMMLPSPLGTPYCPNSLFDPQMLKCAGLGTGDLARFRGGVPLSDEDPVLTTEIVDSLTSSPFSFSMSFDTTVLAVTSVGGGNYHLTFADSLATDGWPYFCSSATTGPMCSGLKPGSFVSVSLRHWDWGTQDPVFQWDVFRVVVDSDFVTPAPPPPPPNDDDPPEDADGRS